MERKIIFLLILIISVWSYDGPVELVPFDRSLAETIESIRDSFPEFNGDDLADMNGHLLFYDLGIDSIYIPTKGHDFWLTGSEAVATNLVQGYRANDLPFVSAEAYLGFQRKHFLVLTKFGVEDNSGRLNYFRNEIVYKVGLGAGLEYPTWGTKLTIYGLDVPIRTPNQFDPMVGLRAESGIQKNDYSINFDSYVELNGRKKFSISTDGRYNFLFLGDWKIGSGIWAKYLSENRDSFRAKKKNKKSRFMEGSFGPEICVLNEEWLSVYGRVGINHYKNIVVSIKLTTNVKTKFDYFLRRNNEHANNITDKRAKNI